MLPGGIARGAHACKSGSSPRCVASGAAGSAGRARGEQLPAAAAGALQQEDSACGGCSSRSELAEQAVRHAAHARSGQEGLAAGPLGSRRRGGLAVQQRGRGGPFQSGGTARPEEREAAQGGGSNCRPRKGRHRRLAQGPHHQPSACGPGAPGGTAAQQQESTVTPRAYFLLLLFSHLFISCCYAMTSFLVN